MPTNNFDAQWLVDWFEELKCKQTAHFMCLMSNMFLLGREYNKKRRMQRTGIDTIRECHAKAMNPYVVWYKYECSDISNFVRCTFLVVKMY